LGKKKEPKANSENSIYAYSGSFVLIETRKYPQTKVCKQEGSDVTASRHHGPNTPSWTEDEEATSNARADSVGTFIDGQNKENPP
jgi:hypothetical protein